MTFRLHAGDLESLLSIIEFNREMPVDSMAAQAAFLRRYQIGPAGETVQTAYLLSNDGTQPGLPSLGDLRDNYRLMTGGAELPIHELFSSSKNGPDLLLNLSIENADGPASSLNTDMLIRSIWNQNHNFWVDKLRADTGGTWTEDQYYQAARAINIAEHQQAAFSEIARALANDTVPGSTVPQVRAGDSVSEGLAAGEALVTLFNENVGLYDGATGELHQLALSDTFTPASAADVLAKSPAPGAAAGASSVAVLNPLPGSRTGLPEHKIDLATVYSARTRDNAPSQLNQVRGELFALTGLASLQPYNDWADFQERNLLSDDVIQDLKAAYPEGVEAMDLWVGGLAETAVQGQLGATLGVLAQSEALDTQVEAETAANAPEVLDRLASLQHFGSQSFAAMVARHISPESAEFQALFEVAEPARVILGDAADNLLLGTDRADLMLGGGGDDVLFGEGGNDVLLGGTGNDVLDGGRGADTMTGDTGDDTFRVDSRDDIVVERDDEGTDTVETTLDTYVLAENVENLRYEGVACFTGEGNESNNIISGGNAADTLSGAAGNDILFGEAGHDTLLGGTGDDTYVVQQAGDVVIEDGGQGTDTVIAYVNSYTLSINVENLVNAGDGYFIGTGNLAGNTISGGSGTDVLFGVGGDDILLGGFGSDILDGGQGNDVLEGGEGDDRLKGGGDGTAEAQAFIGGYESEIILGSASIDVIEANSGSDVVFGGGGADTIDGDRDDDHLDGGAGHDELDGGRGDDDLFGGTGNDNLLGGTDNDHLYGGEGSDHLDGGSDDDDLWGEEGDDQLYGGSGDDRLEGGEGRNLVDGGQGDDWIISVSGQDTIVLEAGFGNDFVAGFDASSSDSGAQNRIDVSSYGFDECNLGFDIQILDSGDGTVITIGSDTLTLLLVDARTIDRNDFIFS